MFSLIVCCVTGALVFLSVLVKPYFYIGKIKLGTYWIISLTGALTLLFSGGVPLGYIIDGLTASSSVNPVKILVLFFGMTALSVFLDEAGFFRYLANAALKRSGKNQLSLFVTLYGVVSVLTVFTSNDIVVLTFTPFICLFAKKADIDPTPYLFAEFVAANTWSMLLIIGNPTNIYLASSAGIDFASYLSKMFLPACLAGIVSFLVLFLLFYKSLKKPIEKEKTAVTTESIGDKPALFLGVGHLAVCTVLLVVSSYLSWEMYLIAAISALSLFVSVSALNLCRKKSLTPVKTSLKRLPYELIPFVLSMFVLVLSLDYSGATEKLSALLSSAPPIYTAGVSSFLLSNVINNIPMSVLFGSLLRAGETGGAYLPNVYAAIVGSNIGAFFTPVGALAGIMWVSILKRFQVDFSFKKFVLYGTAISLPTLFAALLGVTLVF